MKPNMTLAQTMNRFSTEEACKEFLQKQRWSNGVKCPRCGNEKVWALKARPFHWICKAKTCGGRNGYRFSVISKTIFENTNYPLRTWFQVIFLILQSKKGISALQVQRMIGSGAYKTAWYMCHRIRAAMRDGGFAKLMGEVEVDETYIGGKDSNKHWNKKEGKRKTESSKSTVIGAISRKGNVVCKLIESADRVTMSRFVRETVAHNVSLVATDEHSGYYHLAQHFPHETVNHSKKEYVRGNVHTNNLEAFWSTFHQVSKEYLPLYLAEFSYRHNNRENPNIFADVIAEC